MYETMEKYNSYITSDFKVVKVENIQVQLSKIWNHPYIFLNTYYDDNNLVGSCGKFEVLYGILPKSLRFGHRILIFSQSTELLKILEFFLKHNKLHTWF
jgi:SWI/SNF-related matrix-associated actin-dependent regulator of chromatin subfamily A protein 2/4